MSELVTIDVRDHVADVRLNRPERLNSLNRAMWYAVGEAGEALAQDRRIRAVVLSGNGRSFCSGLDTTTFRAILGDPELRDEDIRDRLDPLEGRDENLFQRAALVWKRVPVPVITVLHGPVYGAGVQIALAADVRIAAPDLRLGLLEIMWGLVPDVAATRTLRELLPMDVAKELVYTGRILDAEAAKALGLVTRIEEDARGAAMALAAEIARQSPDAIRAGKRLFDETWHADPATGLAREASTQRALLGRPNQLEAIRAVFGERPPAFDDPE